MKINEFDNEDKLKILIKKSLSNNIDDLEFYKDIEYVHFDKSRLNTNRNVKRHRVLAVVASIAAIMVLSSTLAIFISKGAVNASLFKFEQSFVKLKNELSNNRNSSNEYVNGDSIVKEILNIEDLNKGIEFFPGLFITEKIPERFIFKSLTITKYPNDIYNAIYLYEDSEGQILTISQQTIPQEGLSTSLVGITDEIKTEDGIIYIAENPFEDGGNSATYEKKDFYIDVAGLIEISEILNILE